MLIGYARVSKADGSQSFDLQRDALLAAGVGEDRIYTDRASGKKDKRPGLEACQKALREGDVLVVWKLDRLGRSLHHLVKTVIGLSECGVGLKVLTGQGAQIACTLDGAMPTALAIVRRLQWVASRGGRVCVSSSTRLTTAAASAGWSACPPPSSAVSCCFRYRCRPTTRSGRAEHASAACCHLRSTPPAGPRAPTESSLFCPSRQRRIKTTKWKSFVSGRTLDGGSRTAWRHSVPRWVPMAPIFEKAGIETLGSVRCLSQ